ncbi:hypothetical protein [Roseococcus sp.]|uniref:hypothetical protein n=1 Tax=Roseococcus sp. TaxID=2109646 RepID=UPI003BA93A9A
MTPLVPFTFDPPSSEYFDHLEYSEAPPAASSVRWPLLGIEFKRPEGGYPTLEEIAALNGERFKAYGISGYSIDKYHEFLVDIPSQKFIGFKMGNVEVTFGLATPLVAAIFYPYHEEKYDGPWEHTPSLRITNAPQKDVEVTFIAACAEYEARFGVCPTLSPLAEDYPPEEEEDDRVDKVHTLPPAIGDLEPMRFYHAALLQRDAAAACVSYYRMLEYYSFFANFGAMSALRHDRSVSDAEFSRQTLELIRAMKKGQFSGLLVLLQHRSCSLRL